MAGPGAGLRSKTGLGRAQDWPGRSALVVSPDGVGWPEEPVGFPLRDARDESGLKEGGLGWPPHGAGARQAVDGGSYSQVGGPHGPGRGRAVSRTTDHGQGPVAREGEAEPPARVKQALSAAVSRETEPRRISAQDEAQGSGTVRTRGKPAASAGALLEQEARGTQDGPAATNRGGSVDEPGSPAATSAGTAGDAGQSRSAVRPLAKSSRHRPGSPSVGVSRHRPGPPSARTSGHRPEPLSARASRLRWTCPARPRPPRLPLLVRPRRALRSR